MDPNVPPQSANPLEVVDGLAMPSAGMTVHFPLTSIHGTVRTIGALSDIRNLEMKRKRATNERIAKEVHIGNFSCQSATTRYPRKDGHSSAPRIASWRSNLAALSHDFNLYFTAYIDKIHVTIPQGLKHTISGQPELIINLPRTDKATLVGGYISSHRPHCVNNLKVGKLGKLEILLMACDDGDILAYYTHALQHEVVTLIPSIRCKTSITQPLLHENVGMSAWGLAIHGKSRMIAVGSNFREITLFLPGYTQAGDPSSPTAVPPQSMFPYTLCTAHKGSAVKERRINYRLRYPLGIEGHNVPAVDFASDENGDAQEILAADINGNLWTINIWNGEKTRIPRPEALQGQHHSSGHDSGDDEDENGAGDPPDAMGWGVLFLPLSYFRKEQTPHEATGSASLTKLLGKKDNSAPPQHFDISTTTSAVRDSNSYHPCHPGAARREWEIKKLRGRDDSFGDNESGYRAPDTQYNQERFSVLNRLLTSRIPGSQYTFAPVPKTALTWLQIKKWLAQTITQHPYHPSVVKWVEESMERLDRFRGCQDIEDEIADFREWVEVLSRAADIENFAVLKEPERKFISRFAQETLVTHKTAVIFRAWNHDIQLLPSASNQLLSTICRDIVKQHLTPTTHRAFSAFDRLNMIAVIPGLSLLVIGSQLGRAALVTLTKIEGVGDLDHIPTCRIDLILPLSTHELDHRPLMPLLGLAVGPVPGCQKIWRIIMHYLDHTILCYEVSRSSRDELVVF